MAAASSGRGRGGAITAINVTPLVDITLVLLIIFMVAAKLIVDRSAMSIDLPKAASGTEVQEVFSVVLASPAGTEVDGQTLAGDDAIAGKAAAAARKDREVRAVIKADGAVPHARVMHVLDLLRGAGVSKVAFGVLAVSDHDDRHQPASARAP